VNIASSNYPLGELRGQICPLTDDGDCDGDGVPNIRDGCAQTPPGSIVNGMGCGIDELVSCNGRWKDHNQYVEAFKQVATNFWREGVITIAERNALIKQAEKSSCGGYSDPRQLPCFGPWADHQDYVKAFREVATKAVREGRITAAERNALIKQAQESSCGLAPPPKPPPTSDNGFTATLRGRYEVPPNNSDHVEHATFNLDGNFLSTEIDLVAWHFFSPRAAVYGPASPGENGPLLLEFTNYTYFVHSPVPPLTPDYLVYWGYDELTDEQIRALKAGLLYVNVTSSVYPSGEVRGQICPLTANADCDYDGVPNGRDGCPETPPGVPVDATGCSIAELVPCNGPWKDHKEYVKAFRETAMRFWKEGRITVTQRNELTKRAEKSDCHPPPPPPPCVTHSEPPTIIGETFWLHNGGIITVINGFSYQATLNGIRQTGLYFWAPFGATQFIILMPDDGSPDSTLVINITDLFGCDGRGGTYTIQETGQSGAYTMSRWPD